MRALKILKMIVMVIVMAAVLSFVVMHLWNWLLPGVVGWKAITYWQALGLLVLCKILFGGFHRHGGGRHGWRRQMEERWAKMSPEERERFRAGMRGRHGCRFGGRADETGTEQSAR
jgi:hypothetical protein